MAKEPSMIQRARSARRRNKIRNLQQKEANAGLTVSAGPPPQYVPEGLQCEPAERAVLTARGGDAATDRVYPSTGRSLSKLLARHVKIYDPAQGLDIENLPRIESCIVPIKNCQLVSAPGVSLDPRFVDAAPAVLASAQRKPASFTLAGTTGTDQILGSSGYTATGSYRQQAWGAVVQIVRSASGGKNALPGNITFTWSFNPVGQENTTATSATCQIATVEDASSIRFAVLSYAQIVDGLNVIVPASLGWTGILTEATPNTIIVTNKMSIATTDCSNGESWNITHTPLKGTMLDAFSMIAAARRDDAVVG